MSVEIDSGERILVMRAEGTVKLRVKSVSKIKACVEELLRDKSPQSVPTNAVYDAVVAAGIEVGSREAVLKHLRALAQDGRVVSEPHGTNGAKAWKWVAS